jgi:hypothetical protein
MADSYFTLSSSVVVKTDNKVKPIVSTDSTDLTTKKHGMTTSGSNVCPDLSEIVTKILSVFFKYISSGSVTSSKSSFHVFLLLNL